MEAAAGGKIPGGGSPKNTFLRRAPGPGIGFWGKIALENTKRIGGPEKGPFWGVPGDPKMGRKWARKWALFPPQAPQGGQGPWAPGGP